MDEVLKRIDAHMERSNELTAGVQEASEPHARAFQLLRRESRANIEVLTKPAEAVREVSDEARAQTRAIFRLIDRLDGGAETA